MNIVLAGATGFLGPILVQRLTGRGDSVTVLTRRSSPDRSRFAASVRFVQWNGAGEGEWWTALSGAHAVVNLSGESIAGRRWTTARKRRILASRIGPTRAIVEALRNIAEPPAVLINASAIGYYGGTGSGPVLEEQKSGSGFLAETCFQWEAEALAAAQYGIRVVLPRLGIVLSTGGGALPTMVMPYRLFVGGPVGSGKQWFPWVHIDDVIGAILFLLDREDLTGPVNVVAPEPVTMAAFGKTLGEVLGRPSWLPVPGFAVRIILGEMATLVLEGRQIVPGRLQESCYPFVHPRLSEALRSLLP